MSNNIQATKQNEPPDAPLPPIGEEVLVQGEGFRCLAFRDKDGKWRGAFNRAELHGTIRVITFD